jgi:hypothetical protein
LKISELKILLKKMVEKYCRLKSLLYICVIKQNEKRKIMSYTQNQIQNAKRKYNAMLRIHTIADYDVSIIGMNTAEQRMDYHNSIVNSILAGNKDLEKEWKLFFLNEEVKADEKESESKAKLQANKDASADILDPIKKLKRLGEFGKWLNDSKNPFRKQHFSKKYTIESVNAFLAI